MEHLFEIYVVHFNLLITVEFRMNAFTFMKDTLIYTSPMNTITVQVFQLFQEVP
jgi:hypothetical protein